MHCCVLWCEFIDLVGFFGCYCLTPVTLSPGPGSVLQEKGKKIGVSEKKKNNTGKRSEPRGILGRGKGGGDLNSTLGVLPSRRQVIWHELYTTEALGHRTANMD